MDIKSFFSMTTTKVYNGFEIENETVYNKTKKGMIVEENAEKKEQKVLERISLLPESIVSVVKEYIPLRVTIFLDKSIYLNSRTLIMNFLKKKGITEKYIRYIIRRDFSYVFQLMLNENIYIWYRYSKKYPYNNMIYTSYVFFLIDYCIENQSNRCKETIIHLLEKLGLWKKDNKKIKTTSIRRWR
jgi:hypothetical protein